MLDQAVRMHLVWTYPFNLQNQQTTAYRCHAPREKDGKYEFHGV